MFPSGVFIKIFSVSAALVVFVIIAGCTSVPSRPDMTTPVTTLPAITQTPSPVPSPTTYPVPTSADIQLRSNVYALSSNPQAGIDTIYFTVGLATPAPEIDLTTMEVVVSTPGSAPVTLVQGTKDSTTTFSTDEWQLSRHHPGSPRGGSDYVPGKADYGRFQRVHCSTASHRSSIACCRNSARYA